MIVTVRGANGSGKSTVVREFLSRRRSLTGMRPEYAEHRMKPVGYGDREVFVAGHYERPSMGGIDTFGTLLEAYTVIATRAKTHRRVLYEGKAENDDRDYVRALMDFDVAAIFLTTSLDECVASVRARSSASNIRGGHVARLHRKSLRDAEDLERAGVRVFRLSRECASVMVEHLMTGRVL
jgi:hypothetical protein